MKRFLVLFFVLMLMFCLNTSAKDAFSFEPYEYADSAAPADMSPFFTGYRDSEPEDFVIVEGEKSWHGTHSVAVCMAHEGTSWIVLAKNALEGAGDPILDSTFLPNLFYGDTLYYHLYVPWQAAGTIDSIYIFVRNTSWAHDLHTVYNASDLHYGRWNVLKDGISDTTSSGDPFDLPLIQSDFQIDLVGGVVPACTLYLDAISSKGRVPSKYIDTTGQAGIDALDLNGLVSVAKSSINCIEYALNCDAPVMLTFYDLTGSKKLEIPVGFQPAGSYNFPVDLSPGVYFAEISTDKESKIGKVICFK